MKRLIVTRADENIKEMSDITHPILKRYAEFCEADFTIFKDSDEYHPHYKILQIYDLLKDYDRVACIGTDTLIMKNCPDIFKEVPIHMVGSVYEDKGTRQQDRRARIVNVQRLREDIGWGKGYINSDVLVVSRLHRDIFNLAYDDLYLSLGFDDVELGYQINRNKYEIHELPYQFNHMSMFSEPWNNNVSRFDSFIIHYAGNGFYSMWTKTEQIRQDSILLRKYGLLM